MSMFSTLGPDPSFSPAAACAGRVQVERSRWRSTNELQKAVVVILITNTLLQGGLKTETL